MSQSKSSISIALSKASASAPALSLDCSKLATSRAIFQASSGGGKSYLLRLILESAANQMPVIIIDPEGEFFTMREVCSMVLVGPGGELRAETSTAAKMARGLLEKSCSAIIDLSDLPSNEHGEYVESFLNAMMHAPKKCWRPTLVCIDEAHRFCPEGHRGSGAAAAVIDLMSRGRKRGYGGVLLTQRISKVGKDAVAEAANQFFGRTTLDVDIKRSADMLGMSTKNAQVLRSLKAGEWYAHGPAIESDGVCRFQAMLPTTRPPDPAGQTIPPVMDAEVVSKIAEAMKEILPEDADPINMQEASATISKLQDRIKGLEAETADMGMATIQDRKEIAFLRLKVQQARTVKSAEQVSAVLEPKLREAHAAIDGLIAEVLRNFVEDAEGYTEPEPANLDEGIWEVKPGVPVPPPRPKIRNTGKTLKKAERKILEAAAWFYAIGIESPTAAQVGAIAGYSAGAGHFTNTVGRLVKMGYLERQSGSLILKASASAVISIPDRYSGDIKAHHAFLLQAKSIGGTGRRMLEYIISKTRKSGDELTIEQIADGIRLSAGAGHTSNTIGKLVKICVIERANGKIRTTDTLYPNIP